ncbi:MAG: hypothetical protein EOS17_16810 [Mesorhizobium sp.]|nr:MAG: hypothetical protein EOS17_16810 [Mesorhizobium sp.]
MLRIKSTAWMLVAISVYFSAGTYAGEYNDDDQTFSWKDFLTLGPVGAALKMFGRSNTTVSNERERDELREHQQREQPEAFAREQERLAKEKADLDRLEQERQAQTAAAERADRERNADRERARLERERINDLDRRLRDDPALREQIEKEKELLGGWW